MKLKSLIDCNVNLGYFPNLVNTQKNILNEIFNYNTSFSLISFDGVEFAKEDKLRTRLVNQIIAFKKAYTFVESNKKRLGLSLWVRPHLENNINEVDDFINTYLEFIYSIKINLRTSNIKINDVKLIPYLKLAEKYNLVTNLVINNYNPIFIKFLDKCFKDWPHLNFILTNKSKIKNLNSIINLLSSNSNLFISTSALNKDNLVKLINNRLEDRILFTGELYSEPNNNKYNSFSVDIIKNNLNLSEEVFDKITYQNSSRLFNLNIK
ncbi:MAG: hypothetical protein ACTTID_02010 [Bacillales bacterium]